MTKTEAINHFKGISRLAKALNITYEAVRQWPENDIPLLRQYQIQELTSGELKVSAQTPASDEVA